MSECSDKDFEAKANEIKDGVYVPACLPETQLPIPDELREPKGELPTTEPTQEPPGIPIYSHAMHFECKAGTTGEMVQMVKGVYTSIVEYSGVLSLSRNVLTYIATHDVTSEIATLFHDGLLTPIKLKQLTGMKIKQGRELIALLEAEQTKLDVATTLDAESLLYCYYTNTTQEASCEDPKMAQEYEHAQARYKATILAGTVTSTISQEDADRIAMNMAIAELDCFYINDPFVALCEERPDRPLDEMEPVPNDTEPIYPGRDLRVGRVEVPEGMFLSYVSKEEANERARAYGYSLLVCWYPNEFVRLECEDPDARDKGVDPAKEGITIGDAATNKPGQLIEIPVGFFISEYSTERATEEARLKAESLLVCCFGNDEIIIECDKEEVVLEDGTIEIFEADPELGTNIVTIPANTFFSCVSKEEANMLAESTAIGQLNCIYCSKQVMPHCVPQWIVDGILAGEIEVPLKGDIIEWGDHSINLKDLPPEATIGVKEKAYCTTNAQQSQQLAEVASPSVKRGEETCIYYNDEIVLACAAVDPYDPENEEHWQPLTVHAGVTPDGDPYYFWTMYWHHQCVSEYSMPVPQNYIIIPSGMFEAYGEENKPLANKKAIQFGMSFIRCTWSSPELIGMCGGDNYNKSICDESWFFTKNPASWNKQLADFANGPHNPVKIPRGLFEYVGYGNDEDLAYTYILQEASSFVYSLITCVYTNVDAEEPCVNDYTRDEYTDPPYPCGVYSHYHEQVRELIAGMVPAETIYAETPMQADAIAQEYAENIAACTKDNWEKWYCIGEECPPPQPSPSPSPTTPEGEDDKDPDEPDPDDPDKPNPTPSPTKPTKPPEPPEPPEIPEDDPTPDNCCVSSCPYYSLTINDFEPPSRDDDPPSEIVPNNLQSGQNPAVSIYNNWKLTLDSQSRTIADELEAMNQTLDALNI